MKTNRFGVFQKCQLNITFGCRNCLFDFTILVYTTISGEYSCGNIAVFKCYLALKEILSFLMVPADDDNAYLQLYKCVS